MTAVTAWGRLTNEDHVVTMVHDRDHIAECLKKTKGLGLPYGNGRSYGDVCLNPGGTLWETQNLDRFIAFDEDSGRLVCEAGVRLRDIQRIFIPRGWALPVTPGTQKVTIGGAIANDIHGKNHHVYGSFGAHVLRLALVRTDGEILHCTPDIQPNWFAATVGGMGLTGVIAHAQIQLRRVPGPWVDTETVPYGNLDEFFRLADDSEARWEHTVSWFDCVNAPCGRGLFMRGNHVHVEGKQLPKQRNLSMPIVPPISLVNTLSLRALNTAYYHINKARAKRAIQHYESFLYPLDNIDEWNRIYGPKGFFQYQTVVPREVGRDAVEAMLKEISKSGEGSFLAVLKTFGDKPSVGMMSFAQHGVVLALDFPNRGQRSHNLFLRLDSIVREAKGKLYPAKDARMPKDLFEAGYPRLAEFIHYRDPGISSGLSRRLMGG